MPEYTTRKGYKTIVDEVDADLLNQSWHTRESRHKGAINAVHICRNGSNGKKVFLHRLILERILGRHLEQSEVTDHINGNSLDNRRSNLRIASSSQNSANRRIQSNNQGGLKGVYPSLNKFRAYCKHKYLGSFATAEEAHAAYCKAAQEFYGEFANAGDR